MFSRITTIFTVLFFAMFVTANAVARTNNPPPVTDCTTGSIQCCNSVQDIDNPSVQLLANLLGIVLGPLDALVGLTCSPISVIGGGGNSCSAQTVCCTGNNFSGLLVLGCSPLNINL